MLLPALLGGTFLRLHDLSAKVLHSDEGVNGWFALRLFETGRYCYNPKDYHGPLLYYADLVSFWLMGPSDLSLRLPGALVGAAMPLICLAFLPYFGAVGVATAGALVAFDSPQVYFARTAIHEVWLVAFTLGLVACGVAFARSGKGVFAGLAGGCLAGMFASKETAALTVVALVGACASALLVPKAPGDGSPARARGLGEAAAWLRVHRGALTLGAAVFLAVTVALFSSFGGCWKGVRGFVEAYGFWIDYGASGRNQAKDPLYFLSLLGDSWLAVGLGIGGAAWAVVRRDRFGIFLTAWTLLIVAAYSVIRYKTPWCVLSLSLPLHLLGGWFAGACLAVVRRRGAPRLAWAVPAGVALLCVPTFLHAVDVNHRRYDDPEVPYVYVQTTRGFRELVELVIGIDRAGDHRGQLQVVNVGLKNPLRWYMYTAGWRWNRVRYEKTPPEPDRLRADIVVCDHAFLGRIRKALGDGYEVRSFPVRPGSRASVLVRTPLFEAWAAARGEDGRGAAPGDASRR